MSSVRIIAQADRKDLERLNLFLRCTSQDRYISRDSLFVFITENYFLKEKGKKESSSKQGCPGRPKGNGINSVYGSVGVTLFYAVVFWHIAAVFNRQPIASRLFLPG
jgi:hypothetical protein